MGLFKKNLIFRHGSAFTLLPVLSLGFRRQTGNPETYPIGNIADNANYNRSLNPSQLRKQIKSLLLSGAGQRECFTQYIFFLVPTHPGDEIDNVLVYLQIIYNLEDVEMVKRFFFGDLSRENKQRKILPDY